MAQTNELAKLAKTIDDVAWAMALLAEEYTIEAMRLQRRLSSKV